MWRILNIVAIGGLVGSAAYAYTVKYETILFAEQILKTRHQIADEQDAIARLRAEWALLSRPERLQVLAQAHTPLRELALSQIVPTVADLPNRPPKVDAIGRKLDSLGLAEPTSTPRDHRAAAGAATPPAR